MEKAGKSYYSINEIKSESWSEEWVEWALGAFLLGRQPHSALWIGAVQRYGVFSYQPQEATAGRLGSPTSGRYRTGHNATMFRRNYTRGVVLLNPAANQSASAYVEPGFLDLNGSAVPEGEMVLQGKVAKILVREA